MNSTSTEYVLGAAGAFMASVTWAFSSIRYADVAREVGDARVGLLRALRFTAGVVLLTLQLPRGSSSGARGTPFGYAQLARRLALPLAVDTGLGSICFVYGSRIPISRSVPRCRRSRRWLRCRSRWRWAASASRWAARSQSVSP